MSEINEFGLFPENPVMWRKLVNGEDVMSTDFTIHTVKPPARFDKGVKRMSTYIMEEDRKLAVSKLFIDNFQEDGSLHLSVRFDFYQENGEIWNSKTVPVKEFSKEETEEVMEKRRTRQMAFLRSSVRGTPYESYMASLMTYFKDQEASYVRTGSMDFANDIDATLAIDLSTLPIEQAQMVGSIQGILNAELPRVDDPTTKIAVKNAIKYQMGLYELPKDTDE